MSATGSLNHPEFKNLRDEVKYWKDLALAKKTKIKLLRHQIMGRQPPARKRSASPVEDDTTQKRPKTSSMDPLDSEILQKPVHRYIAQHLTGKDLLAMSEVSTSWNEFAEGQKIGNKVRLKVDLEAMSIEDFKFVANSSRIYKEVSMEAVKETRAAETWVFPATAEKMTINIMPSIDFKDFPKLKSLDLTICDGEDSWILRSNMDQLEELKLTVHGRPEFDYNFEALRRFLSKQANLKRLDLSRCTDDFLQLFDMQPEFEELEYLKAYIPFDILFLQLVQHSLQTLVCLGGSFKAQTHYFLMGLTNLTSLEIWRCANRYWQQYSNNERLPINTKIKKLKLQFVKNRNNRHLPFNLVCQDILLALPKLEYLEIEGLTIKLMELIAFSLLKLKVLTCKNIEDGAWERYEEMKREEVEEINAGIKLVIDIEED